MAFFLNKIRQIYVHLSYIYLVAHLSRHTITDTLIFCASRRRCRPLAETFEILTAQLRT